MRIRFITDGNNNLGLGHIYQSKTFANYIRERHEYKPEIIFLTKSTNEIASIIRKEGYDVLLFSDDNEIFEFLKGDNPDVIIFDKLDVAPEFAKKIHEMLPARLAIFTCITDANKYADVTVMGAMDSHFKNIVTVLEGKIAYHGPKYLILRPEFFKCNSLHKVADNKTKIVTLLFGGADPSGLTCSVLGQLIKINEIECINVIVGNAFKDHEKLNIILQDKHKQKINVFQNISNVNDILSESDLAIVSPGISFFEALKCNTPVLIFSQNEFQQNAWENDIATYSSNQTELVISLINKTDFIFPNDDKVAQMQIGEGVKELITNILK